MTVLVVEDEVVQLQIVRLILEMDGYTVLAAGTAADALELSRQHSGEIALLITDIQMPGMNGIELCHEVTKDRPAIKILLISGTTPDNMIEYDLRKNFMRKPLLPGVLREKVKQLIAGRA